MIKFLFLSIFINFAAAQAADRPSSAANLSQTVATPAPTSAVEPSAPAAGRPRQEDESKKESSSFMGDPEPLDPLPVKKESLKEDEEPVLDDIRDVIDAKLPKKAVTKKTTVKKTKKVIVSRTKRNRKKPKMGDDDSDQGIENKFHQTYKSMNASPTSPEAWSEASKDRQAEIYVVQKGDTLWSISKTLFGDAYFWPKLWALNRQGITNPHLITPGLKIYFYPGTPDSLPTLSVGENFSQSSGRSHRLRSDAGGADIPDSLPMYRNEAYFTKPKEIPIELEQLPVPDEKFLNNIILSDKVISSEVTIPLDAISKDRCGADQIIKGITFKRLPQGPLAIIEKINDVNSPSGILFAYRIIGEAVADGPSNLKITQCQSVLTAQTIFAHSSLVPQMKTQKTNHSPEAFLMGGPDVYDQVLFTFHQYVYINLGNNPFSVGQTLSIKSQLTDKVNGRVKIIEKFGSYGVGVVTSINNTVSRGDTLLQNE